MSEKSFPKIQTGFTLIEVLITIAIFSLLSVVVSAIFLNVNNLQQNTASFQRLQNEGRYMLEKLAREIRSREVAYPVSNPQQYLFFKKDETDKFIRVCLTGNRLNYFIDTQDSSDNEENNRRCQLSGQALNASDIAVEQVNFYVWPLQEDRWGTKPQSDLQPRVTVWLKVKNTGAYLRYQKELILQTTISSKIYKR